MTSSFPGVVEAYWPGVAMGGLRRGVRVKADTTT
jgi:hypothetical protein